MSTILDALKKSEQERKLTDLPTLSDIPAPQEKARWPIVLLVGLLVVSLLIIIWLLLGKAIGNSATLGSAVTESNGGNGGIIDSASPSESSDLTVSIVTYSQDAKQRFAIIDGKMYREGEFVRTGVKVQSIGRDSVTLNNRGELISRQP